MANSKSAKTRIRRNKKRALINGARRSRIRTFIKQVEVAIEAGDATAAREAFKAAEPEMARGVSKGVFHKNTISRKLSRMCAAIRKLETA
ncbi:MAG: 30S ribosomal protein S20 [Alphaproteobacteria bacterium]